MQYRLKTLREMAATPGVTVGQSEIWFVSNSGLAQCNLTPKMFTDLHFQVFGAEALRRGKIARSSSLICEHWFVCNEMFTPLEADAESMVYVTTSPDDVAVGWCRLPGHIAASVDLVEPFSLYARYYCEWELRSRSYTSSEFLAAKQFYQQNPTPPWHTAAAVSCDCGAKFTNEPHYSWCAAKE